MNNSENVDLNQVINQSYKYGFITNVETEKFEAGINENIIALI